MAILGPSCGDKTKVDLKKMIDSSSSEESKETKDLMEIKQTKKNHEVKADSDSSSEELSENDLKEMEAELSKVVTTEQTNHAMRILRGFRKGATESERDAALVSSKIIYCNQI